MSLSALPTLTAPRPEGDLPIRDRRTDERATLAVVSHVAADDVHGDLAAALPGCSVRAWSSDDARAVVDELAHRDLVRLAARGGVIGGVLLGVVTLVFSIVVANQPFGVGAGLGVAVALTGGIFFGSLMGFFLAAVRWEAAHHGLRTHGRGSDEPGVLFIEGPFDAGEVRRILHAHDAIAINTLAA